ncbi:hypothetical protein FYK55_19040 [Roseiconus nitratireducens]|uniref:Uncharacterized protein n=1 Tax=Roseiconus nitratireducens TaxID=2605748 RepID=A0A5M6D0I3_9BACT|nr:prenyltransferase/squalene oxidase repeat-containing protein [Roseiconus nitratireducens]KAA5540997.1 hypothetical protein FYK55_19040 [Roseiconus nitratireducens]
MAACLLTAGRLDAYTPDDPVVIQMVDRGLRFLEQQKIQNPGETVLCAYAHFKVEHDESNEVVKRGIAEAKMFAATVESNPTHKVNYEAAVSVLLLCEISPDRFRSELATFQRYFEGHQMPHGGWGYHGEQEGDVSQTQYAILATWTLDRAGFKLQYNNIVRTIEWLLMVQDKDGPWPYKGEIPTRGALIDQQRTDHSMALAGGSSVLIAGDALGAWGNTTLDVDPGIVGLPKAVKLYKEDPNASQRKQVKVPKDRMLKAVKYMDQWRANTPLKYGGSLEFWFYLIYTLERYESFLEIAEGSAVNASPAWYNDTVSELKKLQDNDGGWSANSYTSPAVSTAFAVLFLIRSTQKALGTGASATTIGGQGFGADVSKSQLVGGKATTQAPAKAVTDMLALLESDDADKLDGKALAENATLPTDPVARSAQLDRLERLVRGSKSWQARRVSAKLLGMSDDLRVVPALIFALSDPDDSVRQYARDGLRFISRKFEGFGMPDEPDNTELRKAQREWRQWYKTMRPGYVFLDGDS